MYIVLSNYIYIVIYLYMYTSRIDMIMPMMLHVLEMSLQVITRYDSDVKDLAKNYSLGSPVIVLVAAGG